MTHPHAQPTLLLTRSEVVGLLDPAALVAPLRAACIATSDARAIPPQRARSPLPAPGGAMVLFPGLVPGIPAYTVKVHAKYPAEQPAIRGVLLLHALDDGRLLAVMDSTYLTAVRTGVVGALAAHTLARPDAAQVAVIGAGTQGRFVLRALAALRPLGRVAVYDTVPAHAERFAAELTPALGLPIVPAPDVPGAVAGAEIIITATWAREPFLHAGMVAPGTHITTLGPDEPGKVEVAADVLRSALVVCDDRDLAVAMGAVGGAGLGAEVIAAELGEVLAGQHSGRTAPEQITVYGGVGLATQDLVAAWAVYTAARARGVGQGIDFLR